MADIKIEDDGELTVELAGTAQRIDIYQSHNRICELRETTDGQPAAFLASVVDYLATELGFPKVSHRAAAKFVDAIGDVVRSLRGKDEVSTTRDSPDSTGPQS